MPTASIVPKRLRSARFKPPKFPPWERLSPLTEAASRLITRHNEHIDEHNNNHYLAKEAFIMLQCPWCYATQDASSVNLYKDDKVRCVMCESCHKTWTSAKWHCACDVPWLSCASCRSTGLGCRPPPRNPKRKAPSLALVTNSKFARGAYATRKRMRRRPPPQVPF